MGKVSNFALVIQLNIPKDKFRIIILSKFFIIGSFVRADILKDPLVRHTLLKEFDGLGTQNYRHCLEYCCVHGVEFVVMKRVYLLVLRNRYYFRVSIGNVYICEYTSLYVSARSWSLFR